MQSLKLSTIKPGRYVLAVSGGVDSMTLLDVLSKQPGFSLIVAHFDHGIRNESKSDRQFVAQVVKNKYQLPFIYDRVELGTTASEEKARVARYKFLRTVLKNSNARAIITAHHQDDLLETAILNLIRGTGRKGLTSLGTRADLVRPLLDIAKTTIYDYARSQDLEWREDRTNKDPRYRRNYIRQNILSEISDSDRKALLNIIKKTRAINYQIDKELDDYLAKNSTSYQLKRKAFNILPYKVSLEVMAQWLRKSGIRDFDKKALERLTVVAKTCRSGQKSDINFAWLMVVGKENLALVPRDR